MKTENVKQEFLTKTEMFKQPELHVKSLQNQ